MHRRPTLPTRQNRQTLQKRTNSSVGPGASAGASASSSYFASSHSPKELRASKNMIVTPIITTLLRKKIQSTNHKLDNNEIKSI